MHYSFLAKSTYEYHPRSRRKKYSDLALLSLIKVVKRHNPSFGYLPMTDTLKIKYGLQVNHKRIYRLMKEHKMLARKYNLRAGKYDSSKGPQGKKAKNRFHQKFKTDRPYQKIVTDISEFRYGNKSMSERLYFSPFKDLYSGEIISYTISQRPQTKYVLDGLKQVLAIRPKLPYRMTIHSDQGIQYQSKAYCQTLKQHHVFQSMSRRATCHDNAACESLFHIMKVELDYYTYTYPTKKALQEAMEKWIKYYNQARIRHTLKGRTPIEYRNTALANMK
ncbi:IS3 family transposase [Lactobacillus melliventris]|uniref:IS3 family transposase n=1 Tax=Lactobacillus melliventris TaxID=1218507 RepID=A0ABX5N140_9LACO|nr:IS3 family transposase [Lactobacillus melliventris]